MIEIEREGVDPPAKSFRLHDEAGTYLTATADDSDQSVHIEVPYSFWIWLEPDDCMTIDELIEGLQALKARWAD